MPELLSSELETAVYQWQSHKYEFRLPRFNTTHTQGTNPINLQGETIGIREEATYQSHLSNWRFCDEFCFWMQNCKKRNGRPSCIYSRIWTSESQSVVCRNLFLRALFCQKIYIKAWHCSSIYPGETAVWANHLVGQLVYLSPALSVDCVQTNLPYARNC